MNELIPLEMHSEAYNEIEGAIRWYDKRSEGLGAQFEKELDLAIACIRESPDTWPKFVSGTRRFFLHRFPFAVVYVYDGTRVRVFAVMHLRRKPGYWLKRMN
jgi:toxin ParE1/3/4